MIVDLENEMADVTEMEFERDEEIERLQAEIDELVRAVDRYMSSVFRVAVTTDDFEDAFDALVIVLDKNRVK